MKSNRVRRTLEGGGVALGTIVFEFATTGIARLAAAAGAQFLLVDQEHTGFSLETVRTVIAAGRADDIAPLVRVPATEYHLVAGALDAGALGVMAPAVESPEQARALASHARYPPLGRRGFGLVYRDEWDPGGAAATIEHANREMLVIAQIETAPGVEHVEEIAAVDGIDALWIGQNDLTASLGIAGRFDARPYLDAVERVLAAGKPVGAMVTSAEEGLRALEQGFRLIAYWGDLWLYQQALADGLAQLEEARNAR